MKIKYKTVIAILFFIFFTTPILSPEINGNTIYIYWLIPFLDFDFVKELIEKKINKWTFTCIVIMAVTVIALGKIMVVIKLLFLAETLLYLMYCYKNGLQKYLYLFISINIFIGLAQFICYYISPSIAYKIGPTYVSRLLWGNLATETYTNQYPIFKLVRVSGWSREAGFFSSLISMTAIVYSFENKEKKHLWQYVIFLIGYIISFSKVSLIYIIIFAVIKFKNILNKVPYFLGVVLTIVAMIICSNLLENIGYYNDVRNESITHRLSGYSIFDELQLDELIFGVNSIGKLNEKCLKKNTFLYDIYRFDVFCGIPYVIINMGIIVGIEFFILLRMFKFRTTEFIVLTLCSFTVNFFTSTSFVVLGYYVCLMMINERKLINDGKWSIENENINNK